MSSSPVARPQPFILEYTQFWWDAIDRHQLVVQECAECGFRRHPPGPACPRCQSFTYTEVVSEGRGTVYSYVISHHPRHPAFEYPLAVVLVDLDEGFRLVAGYLGEHSQVRIGQRVGLEWLTGEGQQTLPVFKPAGVCDD